jgi:KUP system potassium uptake protein
MANHSPTTRQQHGNLLGLSTAAIGVVFGDIGTSPLYTLKTVLSLSGGDCSPDTILGLLSLIIWTLIVVTSVKYAMFAMRIDNKGEGGIMVLMSMLTSKKISRPMVIFAGLFGAALIYGDGAITPAISVLSALEGVNVLFPQAKEYVVPIALLILIGLFAIQPLGATRIGKCFGPIMLTWFFSIACLGISGISHYPTILLAINPWYGIQFLASHGYSSLLVLGGVFLCVTGAEALYADMGHFGRKPIWLGWFVLVFPCLILNYAGQSALLLSGASVSDNLFFLLCPSALQLPLIILATLATIIASQAIITGSFSMTRQAIQLGWLPRLRIKQTAQENAGQIYIGTINILLMSVTLCLVIFFRTSDSLAAAYGIAVSLTMLMTSGLLFIAMREIWHWRVLPSLVVAGIFFIIDSCFLAANLAKILEGGYIPLLLAMLVYGVMLIWHQGIIHVAREMFEETVPVKSFFEKLQNQNIPRVPGMAVFLTRTQKDIPPVMRWHVLRNHALHQKILTLSIVVVNTPYVSGAERLIVKEEITDFWRVIARYGFMERPNITQLVKQLTSEHCPLDAANITYYIGHEMIVGREDKLGVPGWKRNIFALMVRNSMHVTDYYYLPSDQVIEISRRVAI